MNMIQSFNQTLEYIDSVDDRELDEKKILTLSGYSLAMFSRIFSILTEIPLSEYIRRRKMTKAMMDLISSDEKVINLALKYGYDSPDSFTVAFKNIHGVTPSEIRKGKKGIVHSKIRLTLTITGGSEMKVKIEKKSAFRIAGIERKHIASSQCPATWDDLFVKADPETLASLGNGQSYGMCRDVQDPNTINYFAGYDVRDEARAKALGLEIVDIPETEYAVVELVGPIPDCIHAGWKFVMSEFLPENGYTHSGAPDFEVYGDGDMYAADYRMELWVPIVKSA